MGIQVVLDMSIMKKVQFVQGIPILIEKRSNFLLQYPHIDVLELVYAGVPVYEPMRVQGTFVVLDQEGLVEHEVHRGRNHLEVRIFEPLEDRHLQLEIVDEIDRGGVECNLPLYVLLLVPDEELSLLRIVEYEVVNPLDLWVLISLCRMMIQVDFDSNLRERMVSVFRVGVCGSERIGSACSSVVIVAIGV